MELRLHAHTPEPGGAFGVLVGGDQQGWNGMVRAGVLHTAGDAAAYPSRWGRLDPQGTELTGDWADPTRTLSIACSGCGRVDAEQTTLQDQNPRWRRGVSKADGLLCGSQFGPGTSMAL